MAEKKLTLEVKAEDGLKDKVSDVYKNLIRLGFNEMEATDLVVSNLVTQYDRTSSTINIKLDNVYKDFCSRCGKNWSLHDFGVPHPMCP